ncbi:NACHT domain-containing protein [Streptomyces sp. 3MP-14]|uniref:NACHT domain-containing protein n=1 Tax=Streptomyces mimosae TaxID=2586635 RepID=A0A5N6AD21_9ACTN|nr:MULTISPECIES: HEAT repeat domain-containing protein [Streptomyces]KAB8165729.1 NACHT domain-containing protein [Streptomyces mimosae]KAB8176118.1 NACHT domain-containing protein [Streptomyces sp. 3MP-14]
MTGGTGGVRAARTGNASATAGGLANSGVLQIQQLVLQLRSVEGESMVDVEQALNAYTRRVREAYGRLDMEVLTPLSDQGEHQVIELREVFVPPGVREGAPPSTLPPELARRLAEDDDPAPTDRETQRAHRLVEPLLDVLGSERHPRLVLLGNPGAGKSTLGRHLTLTLTQDGPADVLEPLRGRLPLLIELRRCAEERWRDATFEDFLDHLHRTDGLSVPTPVLRQLLAGGRAVVVFDGLDEIFDPAARGRVAQRIAAFASRYPQVRVVVTSRIVGYRQGTLAAAGFSHYTVQDLTDEQIAEFARRWYAVACPEDPALAEILVKRVTDAVAHSRAVRELAGNPLLLTILAIIGRRRTLPRDRQGVYEHAVTVLVAHLDQDVKHLDPAGSPEVREVLEALDARDLLELLRLIARHMQNGEGGIAGNFLHADDLESIIRDYLATFELPPVLARKTARALVHQLRERNFILAHYGGDIYGFVHRAFLEYLAASDIVHRYQEEREWTPEELVGDVLLPRADDEAWAEILLLVTGQLNPADVGLLVDQLIERYRASGDAGLLVLAVRALAEVRRIGVPAMVTRSEAVVDALTNHTEMSPFHWLPAWYIMATFGDHWAGRARLVRWFLLLGQFVLPAWYLSARMSLFNILEPFLYRAPGTPAVLAAHAPVPRVRVAALDALTRLYPEGDQHRHLELVRDRALNDPSPETRAGALTVLAGQQPGETGQLLLERAVNDPDPAPRLAALHGLRREWNQTRAVAEDRAQNDPDPTVRGAAIGFLRMRWPEEFPDGSEEPLVNSADAQILVTEQRAVSDPDPEVRASALEALPWRRLPRAWWETRAIVDPDPGPRATALKRLAHHWPQEARRLLTDRAVHDFEPEPRATALRSLVENRSNPPLELLQDRAVNDPHHDPRLLALRLLAQRAPDIARPLVRDRARNDPHPDVRLYALRMWAVADPAIGPLLLERLRRDPDGVVRAGVAWSLAFGWYQDAEVLGAIRALAAEDPDAEVRAQATAALAAGEAMAAGADHA